ncbi:Z3H7A protein, partial [Corythaeola cristata]|nr:Z3H7A protein [Corythaeola cristata]
MSNVSEERSTRQQDIKKGLQFIEYVFCFFSLFQLFIRELVRNLFNEGNDVYREGDWRGSLSHYTEAISIADYANSEEIHVSDDILEKLHVNRIACFSNMGLHEKVLEDCEIALRLNENNFRALYRKAKALNELGRYKKAYDAVAKCSLAVPQDESVIKLTQELAQKLGLKIRKAYVRAKPPSSNSVSSDVSTQVSFYMFQVQADFKLQGQEMVSAASSSSFVSEVSKVSSVPVPSLSSVMPLQVEKVSLPSAVLANGGTVSFSMPEACLDCGDGDIIIGEELDELLDSVPDPDESVMQTTGARGPIPAGSVAPSVPFSASLLGTLPVSAGFVPSPSLSEIFSQPLASSLENFCSPLSTFSISDPKRGKKANYFSRLNFNFDVLNYMDQVKHAFFQQINGPSSLFGSENYMGIAGQTRNDFSNVFSSATANIPVSSALAGRNPLEGTHELRQACQLCFVKKGPKLLDYAYHPSLEHKCKKDILIGRIKNSEDKSWKKIRPRPTKTQYVGPYYICKDVAAEEECRYPGHCTFAYCQEEIDVWTLERKGAFSREALFGGNGKISLTVSRLLQEHHGLFMFLCEVLFISNDTIKIIIAICNLKKKKCLLFSVICNISGFEALMRFLSVCIYMCVCVCVYGCKCISTPTYNCICIFFPSFTGISHDTIVQESKKYWQNMEASAHGSQVFLDFVDNIWGQAICSRIFHPSVYSLGITIHFLLLTCYPIRVLLGRNEQKSEVIKCKKLLLSLVQDLEQLYDIWLKSQKPEKGDDTAAQASKENGKQIHMPTDYAEVTVDFHCWMCGKNCNSEKQWQGHISSEKHKEKVFHTEDDQNCWQYRFPTGYFSICDRYV